jgi:hypothetical protein
MKHFAPRDPQRVPKPLRLPVVPLLFIKVKITLPGFQFSETGNPQGVILWSGRLIVPRGEREAAKVRTTR